MRNNSCLNVPNFCHFSKKVIFSEYKMPKTFENMLFPHNKYVSYSYLRFYPENMTYFEK